ncbi:helix-turn-helix domain-containing protein [Streptomyces piniterrae]|uniref:helix-turn-helix domain-containing protein n=1 Tax=Streptomyces piniterrae TaxID=2571125 RepID=UPI00145CD57C|nr:helix-turn-helix transcriptional regulator [Streptomyces piniterrae]
MVQAPARPGRRPEYCSAQCRQSFHRLKQQRNRTAADPARDEALLDLTLDLQEEVRHVVRLAAMDGDAEGAIAAVQSAARMKAQIDAVTAGLVQQARARGVRWEAVGRALNVSPETARRVHRRETATRLVQRMVGWRRTDLPSAADVLYGSAGTEGLEELGGQAPAERPEPGPLPLSPQASNRLAPTLSLMQRKAGITLRRLGQRTGVSASYLSQVLAGRKFPSRALTKRFAEECGVDAAEVMTMWEQETRGRTTAAYEGLF